MASPGATRRSPLTSDGTNTPWCSRGRTVGSERGSIDPRQKASRAIGARISSRRGAAHEVLEPTRSGQPAPKGVGSVIVCGGPWATRSGVTPLTSGSQAATRGVRSSGPNASSRFVERGGNVTGWEGRLAKGLSPEPPGSKTGHGPKPPASSRGLRGCKVGGRAREPFRLQRCEEGSSTFLAIHFRGRTGTGHPSSTATRGGCRVTIADSRNAILARGAIPGRSVGRDVVGSSLRHRRRRGTVVFAWTRGSPNRAPGERTVSLVGDRFVRRRRPEARAKGCRRASRLPPSSADGPATRNLRVPLARVSTHQRPIGPPKLERRESARLASRHEPGHGEETARSGEVHRPPTRLELEPTARKATSRSGIRNGSTGARGTCRLLKSIRGIFLAPDVSTKGETLNAWQGLVRRFFVEQTRHRKVTSGADSERTHERRSNEGARGRFSSQRVSSRAASLRSLGSRLRTERRAKGRTS